VSSGGGFFDEITATTGDWAAQVKWLRDNDPEFAAATVVLTGSCRGRRKGTGTRVVRLPV
jgi:hypothetical protein